ncbi:MAG: LEPR-XLL domain-containing protein, partial [Puniceicoccaceae bacterium]
MSSHPPRKNQFELESLEPRLLLSGDGIVGAKAAEALLHQHQENDAIFVEMDASPAAAEVAEDGLFGVEDSALQGQESVAEADPMEAVTSSGIEVEGNEETAVSAQEFSLIYSLHGPSIDSSAGLLQVTALVDRYDPLSQELVTTLHAANGPPMGGDLLEQRDTAEFIISGSEFSIGSGFNVSTPDYANFSLFESPETHFGAGDFLYASGPADAGAEVEPLTQQDLDSILPAAISAWSAYAAANGLTDVLDNLTATVTDLPDGILGEARDGMVLIDPTAAGHGWFVDTTPGESSEFGILNLDGYRMADTSSDAYGKMDLLTATVHEVGHLLGLGHDSGLAVMEETLTAGVRHFLSGNINATSSDPVTANLSAAVAGILDGILDTGPLTFLVINANGNNIPDVTVTGADDPADDITYNDITSIFSSVPSSGDELELAIPADAEWVMTEEGTGVLKIDGYVDLSFTEIENLTGGLANDFFNFNVDAEVSGTVDGGTGNNTFRIVRNADITATDSLVTVGTLSIDITNIGRIEFIGGESTTTADFSAFTGSAYYVKNGFPFLQDGIPTWTEEGPAGVSSTSLYSPVVGAINAIAQHPFDANLIYVGTVGGGVWRGDGTNWENLTDDFSSLGISTLSLSPLDSTGAEVTAMTSNDELVLIAGTGRTSSSYTGTPPRGLLLTTDGGDSWMELGRTELLNLKITRVLTTKLTNAGKQVIFISTLDLDQDNNDVVDDRGGVFRLEIEIDNLAATTTLTSYTLTKISGSAGIGLPAGHYTDLAIDPGSTSAPVRPVRLYAVNPEQGVFMSDDGGTSWSPINTSSGAPDSVNIASGSDSDGDGIDNYFEDKKRMKLAVSAADGTVYVGIVGPNTHGQNGTGLNDIFKSTDFGSNWFEIDIPTSTDGSPATETGLHPGGQGDLHFSLAVDPNNSSVIYVGGDRQPSRTNNSVGLSGGGGRVFRYTGSAWEQIVGSTVNNTTPHADSRFITFDTAGNLLEADDGGIYRLTNPLNLPGPTREWTSIVGDLRVTESSSVDYDPVNKVILVGTQDNGSSVQSLTASNGVDDDGMNGIDDYNERVSGWTQIHGGDGAVQTVVAIDTNADTVDDRVVRFSMSNNFNWVFKETYDDTGTRIGDRERANLTSSSSDVRLSGITNDLDSAFTGFTHIPVAANRFVDGKLLIAMFGIYTTDDYFETVERVYEGEENRNANGSYPFFYKKVNSLVYGGMEGGVQKPDLIMASIHDDIVYRVDATQEWRTVSIDPAYKILDIVVDPDNWKTVYAVDNKHVYKTADITAAEPEWNRISGRATDLRTIEYITHPTGDILMIGASAGVYRLVEPENVNDVGDAEWVAFGDNLPNSPVNDLRYIDVDKDNQISDPDILLAALMGRGAWSMSNLNRQGIGEFIPQFVGTTGADHFKVIRSAENSTQVKVFDLNFSTSVPVFTSSVAGVKGMVFLLRGGDDTLTLDHSNGAIAFADGIFYDGGDGADSAVLLGEDIDDVFSGTIDGNDYYTVYDENGARQLLLYNNVETLDNSAFLGWSNPLNSIKIGLYWLGELLGIKDEKVPVFGSSLENAMSGTVPEERAPRGDPTRAPSVPEIDQASQTSNTENLVQRLIESGPGSFRISDIGGLISTGADLANALDGLDSTPGNVTFTDGSGDPSPYLEWDVQIIKTLSGQADLEFDFDVGIGDIDITGGIEVSADLTLDMVFGVDPNGFYIRTRDGDPSAGPELSLGNIVVDVSDDVKAIGRFGFINVALTEVDLAVDSAVALEVDITTGGGSDTQLRVQDFFTDPLGLFDLSLVGNPTNASDGDPNTNDLFLTGTFTISPFVPGDPTQAFDLGTVKVDMKWADITDISSVAVTANPTFTGGEQLMKFLNIDPDVLLQKIETVRDYLDAFGVEIPYVDQALDTFTDLTSGFNNSVLGGLDSDPSNPSGGASFNSVQDLADRTAEGLGSDISDLGFNFDISTAELTYTVDLSHDVSGTEALDFRLDALNGLLAGDFSYTASGNLLFTVGIDLDDLISGDAGDAIFLRDVSAGGAAEFTLSSLTATAGANGLNFGIVNGDVTANASLNFELADPTPSDNRITINELVAAVGSDPLSLVSNTSFSAGASLTNLEIDLGGFVYLSGDFNISTDTLSSVTVTDGTTPEVLSDLPVTTIGAESGTIFVGANYGSDSEVGFTTTISSLGVVIIEHGSTSRTWNAVQGTISSASLSGVTGLTVLAEDLTLDYNGHASDDTYVDFTLIDADGAGGADGSYTVMAGATPIVFNYSTPITKVTADASLDLFGFVVGTATFEITSTVMDVVTGNASIPGSGGSLSDPVEADVAGTLKNASVLTASVSNLNLFGGLGASITTNDATTISDDALDLTNAIGFSIIGGTASFALVRPADVTAGDQRSYLGFEASLAEASLQGITGFDFWASGTFKLNLAKDTSGNIISVRVDWATATNETNDPNGIIPAFTIGSGLELGVSGNAAVDLGPGVFVAAISGLDLKIGSTTVTDGTTTLTDAEYVSVSGTANVFAGVGGSLNVAKDDVVDGTIGFAVDGVSMDMVMATGAVDDPVVDNRGDTYLGLDVSMSTAQLIGVNGLDFYASGDLKVNSATDSDGSTELTPRMDWALATNGTNDPNDLLGTVDVISAVELQISGGTVGL